jgi:hypothetical protein
MARELYTTKMLPRRFLRMTAALMMVLMGLATALGYDFHQGRNITETFFESFGGCF